MAQSRCPKPRSKRAGPSSRKRPSSKPMDSASWESSLRSLKALILGGSKWAAKGSGLTCEKVSYGLNRKLACLDTLMRHLHSILMGGIALGIEFNVEGNIYSFSAENQRLLMSAVLRSHPSKLKALSWKSRVYETWRYMVKRMISWGTWLLLPWWRLTTIRRD